MLKDKRNIRKRSSPSPRPTKQKRGRFSEDYSSLSRTKFPEPQQRQDDVWDDDREISYYDFAGGMDHGYFGFMEVTPCSQQLPQQNLQTSPRGPSPIPHSPPPSSPPVVHHPITHPPSYVTKSPKKPSSSKNSSSSHSKSSSSHSKSSSSSHSKGSQTSSSHSKAPSTSSSHSKTPHSKTSHSKTSSSKSSSSFSTLRPQKQPTAKTPPSSPLTPPRKESLLLPDPISSPLSSPSLSPCSNSLFLPPSPGDDILPSPGVIPETQEVSAIHGISSPHFPLNNKTTAITTTNDNNTNEKNSLFNLVTARPRSITNTKSLDDSANLSFIPATPDPDLLLPAPPPPPLNHQTDKGKARRNNDNKDKETTTFDALFLPAPISQCPSPPGGGGEEEGVGEGDSFIPSSFSSPLPPKHYLQKDEETLSFFEGLPEELIDIYGKLGGGKPYEWQVNCMNSIKRDYPRNFLFTVPTSGEKALIAEVCLLRCSFLEKKKGLYLLPSVSLVLEKVEQLCQLGKVTKARALAYYGSQGVVPLPSGNQIIVCTFERAEGIINSLISEKRMSEVGTVIVDELHMLEEGSRGASLEMILTKIQAVSEKKVQIVGMSATIPNLPELADWLEAKWEIARGRPIPLVEMLLVDNQLYDRTGVPLRSIPTTAPKDDKQSLLFLTQEVVNQGHSVLIFCPSKSSTRATAVHLAEHLVWGGRGGGEEEEVKNRQMMVSLDLKACGTKCNYLREMTMKGVAYHHSGMTSEERDIIEKGFRKQALQVLCTTTQLPAGVTLPCRRVIIRSPRIGNHPLGNRQYRQIVGRAGRVGVDTSGDAILITTSRESADAYKLVNQPLPPVESALHTLINEKHDRPLLQLVLDAVVGLGARTYLEIEQYFNTTLFVYQQQNNGGTMFGKGGEGEKTYSNHLRAALDFLIQPPIMYPIQSSFFSTNHPISFLEKRRLVVERGSGSGSGGGGFEDVFEDDIEFSMISMESSSKGVEVIENFEWVPSSLGEATFLSSLSPDETLFVYHDLKQALDKGLILSHDLHACFLLCPLRIESSIPWEKFHQIYNGAPQVVRNLAEVICVGPGSSFETQAFERFVRAKAQHNTSWLKQTSDETKRMAFRLYWAWILVEFIGETDPGSLAAKYSLDRGNVESVKTQAATFSFRVIHFAKRLGWHSLSDSLTTISKRFDFGGKQDIIELCEIKGLRAQRARALHTAGFSSLEKILQSSLEKIHSKLQDHRLEETFGLDVSMQKKNIRIIMENVQRCQLERVNSLLEEARSLVVLGGGGGGRRGRGGEVELFL